MTHTAWLTHYCLANIICRGHVAFRDLDACLLSKSSYASVLAGSFNSRIELLNYIRIQYTVCTVFALGNTTTWLFSASDLPVGSR